MRKIKTSYYYLERGFPENIEPAFTNKSTKRKRFLVERKKKILKRAIRKSLQTLVKPFFSAATKKSFLLERPGARFQNVFSEEGEKCKRYQFLFPLHKLKGELSKRESQYGKIELYKKQIQEKKKLAFLYGRMSKNSIKKLVEQARNLSSTENPPVKGLVTLLESRLDVVLFRASFFSSISMARQWINHSKVHVNKKKVRAPSYQLKGGDCVEILSTCAFPLKEKIRGRVAIILPFRRSRKKLVTNSLMENWCSFESLFSLEKGTSSQISPCPGYKEIPAGPAITQNSSLIKDHLQSMWEKSVQSQQSNGTFDFVKCKSSFYKSKRSWQVGDGNPRQKRDLPLSVYLKSKCHANLESVKGGNSLSSLTTNKFPQSGPLPGKEREKAGEFALRMQKERSFNKTSSKGPTSSTKIDSALQKGVALFGRLSPLFSKKDRKQMIHKTFAERLIYDRGLESGLATVHLLKGKQALVQPRNRMQKLAGLQVSAIKPLHLEVSYRLLTAIFLYSPQKVAYPCSLDLPLIIRSFK